MKNQSPRQQGSHESGIVQRVRKSLRYLPGDQPHVLLACSAGEDSVALAAILAELARLNSLTLTIAHIHHGQHDRADEAANAVQTIGTILNVPVVIRHLTLEAIAVHTGLGVEEALRRERYLALGKIAADVGATGIALAHHQSDQAETLLLHLMRGSGVDGLAGMKAWEIRTIPWWGEPPVTAIGIWRPLLLETAERVAEIARRSGLPIVEDPTNADRSFRRNAIRHDVLPMLERISPGSTAAIARSGAVIATDALLLTEAMSVYLADCRAEGGLARKPLVTLPDGWQLRVVRAWLMESVNDVDVSHDRIGAIVELARRNRGGSRVEIGAGIDVVLRRGVLGIEIVAE